MYCLLRRAARGNRFFHTTNSLSLCSKLIDQCLALRQPTNCAKLVHARLIKLGFNVTTFLGNRCIDMYGKVGLFSDALKAFDDILERNVFSWNICLRVLMQIGDVNKARQLFDEMPERDVVSWNSMISGYLSYGFSEKALELFVDMRRDGVRSSGFTYSILMTSVWCGFVGREIHCCLIRDGVDVSNMVVLNSLIDMYGKVGLVEYAVGVFRSMEEVDVISWNSLISVCCSCGVYELALELSSLMRECGYVPDEFTLSATFSACSNLQDLEKGKQILCLCVKMGFLSNTIVSSAAIDYLSKCNRMEDSVLIFEESRVWDSALCNSMISTYARHGLEEKAFRLFVTALRENVRPTEVTLSSIISCVSNFFSLEEGSQMLSFMVKSGFELDFIVASSLIDMYVKFGLVDCALEIFVNMAVKDLIAWNTIITGLALHGQLHQSIALFKELIWSGLEPDKITFSGILLACSYGGFLEEGIGIFYSMQKDYGIIPTDEHYTFIVDLLSRAGMIEEAIGILTTIRPPNLKMWESIFLACGKYGDQKLVERVAEKMVELNIESYLAYSVLARAYEQRCRWESLVRIRRLMKRMGESVDCCRVGVGRTVFDFGPNQTIEHCDKDAYSLLRLMGQEMDEPNLHYCFCDGLMEQVER